MRVSGKVGGAAGGETSTRVRLAGGLGDKGTLRVLLPEQADKLLPWYMQ